MAPSEKKSIGSRLEHYLLIHEHAIPAWLAYMAVTMAVMVYTLISAPIVARSPEPNHRSCQASCSRGVCSG